MSRSIHRITAAASAAVALTLGTLACNVETTEEGEMPDVDVSGTPGQLPEYEVRKTQEGEMPDVDVDVESGKLPEVEGPDVEIERDTVEVPYPDIDVDVPDDDPATEEEQQ